MKQIFLILAVVGLVACNQDECCEKHIPVILGGVQFYFPQDGGVIDSLMFNEYEHTDSVVIFGPDLPGEMDNPIDSLQNVRELLDYLETIPSTHH